MAAARMTRQQQEDAGRAAPRVTRFTKIAFNGQKVRLEYHVTRPGGGDPDEFVVNCSDKPLPSFMEALAALVADVLAICEFPRSEASKFTVRGVALSYTDGVMGAVLTALRALSTADAPLIINSPYLSEQPRESDPGGYRLPATTVRGLLTLIDEAERYLRGDRAQGSLFEAPPITLVVSELPPDDQAQPGAPV
ncbi:MAG: hypothetical protein A3J29_07950 [Acidobacteria bacterium RIFCSPLOWO2_12_FULL_67_14b]|nr:MAG: hypothetical protein A3J29_07950 [Acidobacteria bacterium RIFCSPLOWO2_12_FULL_67_14b]